MRLRRSGTTSFVVSSVVALLLAASCAPPPDEPAPKTEPDPKPAAADAKPVADRGELPDADLSDLPGRIHVVQPGDTLYSLAEKYYGHGRHYQKILMANRKRLTDPNDLPVGMKLIIP